MTEILINNRYLIGPLIGKGLFSEIFDAKMIYANNAHVAAKLEDIDSKYPQLEFEARIMDKLQGNIGVPLVYYSGECGDYQTLVMQKLGSNLKTLLDKSTGRFGLKTTLLLADKMLCIIEQVHKKGIIHRDIKPENWCIGEGADSHNLYLIDYGLSKVYINERGKHIPHKKNKTMLGQAIFASVNSHKTIEVSRRDDIESILYMLLLMVVGDLPWIKTIYPPKGSKFYKMKKETRLLNVYEQKEEFSNFQAEGNFFTTYKVSLRHTNDSNICSIPREFREVLQMVRNLNFDEEPNYTLYRSKFKQAFRRHFRLFEQNMVYDWNLIGKFGLGIEDNIRALEEDVFNLNLPPPEVQNQIYKRKQKRNLSNRLGKWKEGYIQDSNKPDDIKTEDLINKVRANHNRFKMIEQKIRDEIDEYDLQIQTEKLKQLNIANMSDKKSASRRQSQAQNQGTRSLSIQNARPNTRGNSVQPRGANRASNAGRQNRSVSKVGRGRRGQGDKNCKVM